MNNPKGTVTDMTDVTPDEIQERMSAVAQRAERVGISLMGLRINWLEHNLFADRSETDRLGYEAGFLAVAENVLDEVEPQAKKSKLAVVTQMPGQQGLDLGA